MTFWLFKQTFFKYLDGKGKITDSNFVFYHCIERGPTGRIATAQIPIGAKTIGWQK